jgi:YVTN family beta-propeller protein
VGAVISTATNTVTATVVVGSRPYGVAVTPDGSRVYVANGFSDTVSVISTATNTVTATVAVGTEPLAFGKFIGPATPAQQLTDLATLIVGFGLPHGITNSLLAKVSAAQASVAAGNATAACHQLQALINEAEAQSGKQMSAGQASAIITAAQAIQSALACP